MSDPVYNGPSSHLVARLLLMVGMICAVVSQLIGLQTQMNLEREQIGNMKSLQTRLYKETVIALTSRNVDEHLKETSQPWSGVNSVESGEESSENPPIDLIEEIEAPSGPLLDESRKLAIQGFVNKQNHVPLNEAGQIDWNQIDHVYYYHTRKAG